MAGLYLAGALSDLPPPAAEEGEGEEGEALPTPLALSDAEAELAVEWARSLIEASPADRLVPLLRLGPAGAASTLVRRLRGGDGAGGASAAAAAAANPLPGLMRALLAAVRAAAAAEAEAEAAMSDAGGEGEEEEGARGGTLLRCLRAAVAESSAGVARAVNGGAAAALAERAALVARGWAAAPALGSSGGGAPAPLQPAGAAGELSAGGGGGGGGGGGSSGLGAFCGGSGGWPALPRAALLESLQCGVCFGTLYEPVTLPLCRAFDAGGAELLCVAPPPPPPSPTLPLQSTACAARASCERSTTVPSARCAARTRPPFCARARTATP